MSLPYINPSRRLITFGPYGIGAIRLQKYIQASKAKALSLSSWACSELDKCLGLKLPLPFGRGVPRKEIREQFRLKSKKKRS